MIKQNIKIAIFVIFALLGFWAIACAFIKIDISEQTVIGFVEGQTQLYCTNKTSNYIESHDITNIKVRYQNENYQAKIYYLTQDDEYTTYSLICQIPSKESGYILSQAIITSMNVYQYLFKK